MKFLKLILLLFPVLLFGQEPQIFPMQFRGDGTSTSILTSSGTAAAWQTQANAAVGLNYWQLSGGDVYRPSGNVGIGVTPTHKLHVAGGVKAQSITLNETGASFIDFGSGWTVGSFNVSNFGTTIFSISSSVGSLQVPFGVQDIGTLQFPFSVKGGYVVGGQYIARFRNSADVNALMVECDLKTSMFGAVRMATFTTNNRLLRADASGNLSQTLPAISTASITTTLDFGSNIAKTASTDEIREEVGSSFHLYRKLTDGTQRRPQLVGNPATIQSGSEWFDISVNAPTWATGSTATDVRHAASIEGDFIGAAPTAHAASFTLGATPTVLFRSVDANTTAITITCDLTMREGIPYTIACRRNTVNAITIDVPSGSQLDANGDTNFNDDGHTLPMHSVVTITRHSATNYTVK
jgi:hypothetical protein